MQCVKAVVLTEFGGPDVFEVREVPEPVPGATEVKPQCNRSVTVV